jgi:hypothetical protein
MSQHEDAAAILTFVQAIAEGKIVETMCRQFPGQPEEWHDTDLLYIIRNPELPYRIRPVPREWWILIDDGLERVCHLDPGGNRVHVREVL